MGTWLSSARHSSKIPARPPLAVGKETEPSLASLGRRDGLLLWPEEPTFLSLARGSSCQEKEQPLVTDWGTERVGEMYEKVRTVIVQCTLYSVHCILYSVHCIMYSVHCKL